MASLGSIFTGNPDPTDETNPLKDIVTSSAGALYDQTLGDPKSRAALMQIGLNLMQPTAMGQTTMGQIGQALGGGGEAVGRLDKDEREQEELDIKRQSADDRLTIAELKLKNARNPEELTEYQRQMLRENRRGRRSQERQQDRQDSAADAKSEQERQEKIQKRVEAAVENRDSLVKKDTDPEKARWKGKTDDMIRQEIEAAVPPAPKIARQGPSSKALDDDDDDDGEMTVDRSKVTPGTPTARSKDGKTQKAYIGGKWMTVK